MTVRYSVHDPKTGDNTRVESQEEAISLFWQRMVDFALPYFHNTIYSTVEIREDGSEVWTNESGDEVEKPLSLAEKLAAIQSKKPKVKAIENPTAIEVLP